MGGPILKCSFPWYSRTVFLASLWLVLDQLSKWFFEQWLPLGTYHFPGPKTFIPGFIYWVHIGNKGAAWGMFQGMGWLLAVIGCFALGMLFIFRRHLELERWSNRLALGLLCGGVVGNILDRIFRGHVVDFIDVHLGSYRWPAFNVADMGICIGAVYFLILSLFQKDDQPGEKDSKAS